VLTSTRSGQTAARKNIRLIIADDLGADSCELFNSTNTGASLAPTPPLSPQWKVD